MCVCICLCVYVCVCLCVCLHAVSRLVPIIASIFPVGVALIACAVPVKGEHALRRTCLQRGSGN